MKTKEHLPVHFRRPVEPKERDHERDEMAANISPQNPGMKLDMDLHPSIHSPICPSSQLFIECPHVPADTVLVQGEQ